ncbi:methionyl-tRNA formyltransferase [mine drainage metagenome]|uniref:Methionyl-tRNA formyltransferase n=1 Tax=mine drainage metagenome TaxID=410659 RepID=A0A1J5RTP1_9ZZZZ
MRILLLTHAFNSLTQRLHVDLRRLGHEVLVEFDINDAVTIEAVALARPDVIIAPFLKRAIPDMVWKNHVCLVVHPGIEGDRGPSALDWAILEGRAEWGVTLLQATGEMDGGPVWESRRFPMRPAAKSSLYRREVTEAAVEAVLAAIARFPEAAAHPPPPGAWKPAMTQADRAIDWQRDDSALILRKIRSADGMPGVADRLRGKAVFLHDAAPAPGLAGPPGQVIARAGGAVALGSRDGAVWIGHLREKGGFKLPATLILAGLLEDVPEVPGPDEIQYREEDGVGYLSFAFLNGAMDSGQCERLRAAYRQALRRPTRVIALLGGPDLWSNGIHLNRIEAADSPADESWRNINAMDDLCRDIITTTSHLTIAALRGNAGAGGVFLALAADRVAARRGIVLNPHYKGMGNLYGSEYWTYLLPRRAGPEAARRVTEGRLPVGVDEARDLGLVDAVLPAAAAAAEAALKDMARALAADPDLESLLAAKRARRAADEAAKPLEAYRTGELERMTLNFYGFDPSYHVARHDFVFKVAKSRTPLHLALHRKKPGRGAA